AKMMKWLDPSIELVACGSSNYEMDTFGYWEDTVLEACYDEVDYLSLHQYFGNQDNNTGDFLANTVILDQFISSVAAVCDAVRARKKRSKRIHLSLDEWNVWYHSNEQDKMIERWSRAPHQLEDVYNFEDALLVAGILITVLRHADRVKVACLAQLVNVIAPIMTSDTGAWKQTIYYPFELVSRYGRGKVLHTLVQSPAYESSHGDAPFLDSVVTMDEEAGTVTLFAVNKSLDEDMELSCDLRQFRDYRVKRHVVLAHGDVKAENTEERPDTVVPAENGKSAVAGGMLTAILPEKSFHVIVLGR
ncbi:MAG TPA: alpha-N-arabinofuranosidase, partial [Lachnospiraceae bacterium]|nr:alpha-N-arabinofuranosidase [Lachnospiraceae bacterium]